MARAPRKDKAASPLEEQARARLKAAREWKARFDVDFRECYFFASPWRQRMMRSDTAMAQLPRKDAAELQTSLAMLLCQDFVTEIVNTYMPEAQRWVERGRGMFINSDVWDQIKDQIKKDDEQIFIAMKASNLYSEIQKSFFPDLSIGTCGLWIKQDHAHQPISILAVPLRELEVNLGPNGEIDDRFAVRTTRNVHVRGLLPGIDIPKDVVDECDTQPEKQTQIAWGYWRQWDEVGDEVWQHTVMIKERVVHDAVLRGEGSCPLIVPRFNPSADWPWGQGPLLLGLPDFRQVDELEGQKIENVERHLNPAITYPDDSFAAVEEGIEPGMGYPIRPGTEGAVKAIYAPGPPDTAIYQTEEMEKRLRKMFYVDFPEQTGDTPPTLGQWLDEMARAQRRIGTPGMPFWREGPCKIFLRFKYLLEVAGAIKPVQVDGRAIAAVPYNPAQRAAEQQEIATAMQYAQMMGQMFPEEWKMNMDGSGTMKLFGEKMRVLPMFKFRDPDQVKAAVAQMAQLVGARHEPGGAGAPAAGPPAAA